MDWFTPGRLPTFLYGLSPGPGGLVTLSFDVTTDKTSPAGKHGVFCQVVIEKGGEQVVHNVGGGELRIDVPLPPKAAAATPPAGAKPAAPAAPAERRLSRLEQLRKDQEEKEKAAKKEEKKN